jgi:antitoxin YefM
MLQCAKSKEFAMSIPASTARANLFSLIKEVNDDQEAVLITSNAGNAVLVSESEWESMLETLYLITHDESRKKILKARMDLSKGLGIPLNYKNGEMLEALQAIAEGK